MFGVVPIRLAPSMGVGIKNGPQVNRDNSDGGMKTCVYQLAQIKRLISLGNSLASVMSVLQNPWHASTGGSSGADASDSEPLEPAVPAVWIIKLPRQSPHVLGYMSVAVRPPSQGVRHRDRAQRRVTNQR